MLPGQGQGKEKQSKSILKVGVARALEEIHFDKAALLERVGEYDWSKKSEGGFGAKVLEQLEL